MNNGALLQFDQPDLCSRIETLSEADLDDLSFGVIGFDASTTVTLYNTFESKYAGLSRERVVGNPLFTIVAPCMNNFMVAHRFEEAATNGTALDDTIAYVLTLRMRPVKVKLRLIAAPNAVTRYVLVLRTV
jgi:photoactive yellow protein